MDCAVEDESNFTPDNDDLNDIESSENFQKFIHELFERNGVLNDLRAYLRGHIVNVLKSAETGDPLNCQKHFTQRLELTYQALNILIAEYLLRLEFSYSLSVFISEIPLSNMVFEFARTILKTADTNSTGLRFGECDVWAILNYLGIKCDSEHASKIVELYNSSQESPLLFCILKCLQLYEKAPFNIELIHTSDDNMSSDKTTDVDTEDERKKKRSPKNMLSKCKHYAFCKTCQSKINKLKSRYEKKQKKLEKIAKKSSINNNSYVSFIKTVNDVEQSLVDEMFEEVKSVYEGEVEMIKEDEQKKIKRSIARHALELQRYKEQLEESYRAKEEKLEENVKQKKKFLWGLARALRDQHQSMATAMIDVKLETERLIEKENDLKKQLEGAERMLKNKGEKLHNQIVQEIKLLAAHLESMKTEREALDKERNDLDNLKQIYDKNDKILAEYKNNKEDLKVHYVSLKEELNVLKKCIEDKVESKRVVEKGTGTEEKNGEEKSFMNNGVSVRNDDGEEDKLKHLVINDFKKKNVNFSKSNQEGKRQSSSSETDIAEACSTHAVRLLREENERLKKFAVQQSEHIDALSRERNILQHRVSTALPTMLLPQCLVTNRVPQAGGEEVSSGPALRARELRPGEPVPFIGKDRPTDTRRHLFNQWRTHRRPPSATTPTSATPEQFVQSVPECIPEINISDNIEVDDDRRSLQTNDSEVAEPSPALNINKRREKSPKSVLKETKKKLRNKSTTKHQPIFREKSPNATLREAKLRLRKLEIEAEAVEKSYIDYRKRQSETKLSKSNVTLSNEVMLDEVKHLNIKQGKIQQKLNEKYKIFDTSLKESPELIKKDFDKYLREYQTKYDIGQIHFPNKNAILEKVKPIPSSYSKFDEKLEKGAKNPNYLETPITEFRRYYQNENSDRKINTDVGYVERSYEEHKEHQNEDKNIKCNKPAELEIVKDNIKNRKNNNVTKVLPETDEEVHEVNIKQDVNENNVNNVKLENVESNIILDNKQKVSEVISNIDVVKSSDQILDFEQKLEEKIEDIQNNQELKDLKSNTLENDDAIQNKENLLILEVDNVREENSIQVTKSEDILLIVESAIDNREVENQKGNEISTQMTIIISPKTPKNEETDENDIKISSPEKIEKLTENDALNAIFYAKNNEVSSEDLSKKLKESSKSNNSEEYGEDFSADVDNYNSHSDLDTNSPISLPKTSEVDDNFWDT